MAEKYDDIYTVTINVKGTSENGNKGTSENGKKQTVTLGLLALVIAGLYFLGEKSGTRKPGKR